MGIINEIVSLDESTLNNARSLQNNIVDIDSSINLDLCRVKKWGSHNLVDFNAVKTQC